MKQILFVLAIISAGLALGAAENPAPQNPEKQNPEKQNPAIRKMPRRGGDGRFWRVFSHMSKEERRNMLELQAKDPAAFQAAMKAKVEALRAADEARRKKMEVLAQRCRTGSEQEKAAAQAELEQIFRKSFQRRLADSRNHLREMQRRIRKFEADLKRMEANADQEVRRAVEDCIQGRPPELPEREKPPFPPRRPGLPPGPPPKR